MAITTYQVAAAAVQSCFVSVSLHLRCPGAASSRVEGVLVERHGRNVFHHRQALQRPRPWGLAHSAAAIERCVSGTHTYCRSVTSGHHSGRRWRCFAYTQLAVALDPAVRGCWYLIVRTGSHQNQHPPGYEQDLTQRRRSASPTSITFPC